MRRRRRRRRRRQRALLRVSRRCAREREKTNASFRGEIFLLTAFARNFARKKREREREERMLDDDDDDDVSDDSETRSTSSFDATCPLELLLDPHFLGEKELTAKSMLRTISNLSAQDLAKTSERCTCPKGVSCRFRKLTDSDEAWWPHCAKAWFEEDSVPPFRKPPKDKKTWKAAYLALKPEEGPTPMELEERRLKQERIEAKALKWSMENKAGKGAIKARSKEGGVELAVDRKKADKATLREFYKTVRAKPKGRGHREGTKAFDAGA